MNGLLSLLIFLPVVGDPRVSSSCRARRPGLIRWVATLFTGAEFLLSLPLWTFTGFRTSGDFFFRETHDWIPSLGAKYALGVDGIAALLILLTTLLSFISVYSSFTAITKREKEYYAFLLLLETGMIGVFCALDFFLFYVFWEVMLVPMYFLIGIWGGPRKLYAAIKFFLYTLAGSVVMLLAIIALYFFNTSGFLWWKGLGNAPTFDIVHFQAIASQIPPDLQIWLFWAFFLGFAIKVPMFPFHTWLPDAHVEAPTAGSVILAGVLLKMGTYGFLRFSLPICPDASRTRASWATRRWVVALSIIGIVYGSMVAMVQKDMKKLVAYSSVAHLGFVMLGLFALNNAGIQGGILQSINHGLSTGGLFLLVGIVYERTPHPHDRGLRRPLRRHARLRDALHGHPARVDRPAAPERVHRRVHDPARARSSPTGAGPPGRASASSSARRTCSGSTSASSSASSRTRRTRGSRT